jgi:hypothetical protein
MLMHHVAESVDSVEEQLWLQDRMTLQLVALSQRRYFAPYIGSCG